jgi:hypothetical protein
MLPYLIAGAIGFGIGKLFEEGGETFGRGGMTNEDILRSFLTSERETQTNNLATFYSTLGNVMLLRNYGTLIAKRNGRRVEITNVKYSKTTSAITNRLKALAEEMGYSVQYVDKFEGGGGVEGIKNRAEKLLEESISYRWVNTDMGSGWSFELESPSDRSVFNILEEHTYLDEFSPEDAGFEDWDDLSEEDKDYYYQEWKEEFYQGAFERFKEKCMKHLDDFIEYLQKDSDENFAGGGKVGMINYYIGGLVDEEIPFEYKGEEIEFNYLVGFHEGGIESMETYKETPSGYYVRIDPYGHSSNIRRFVYPEKDIEIAYLSELRAITMLLFEAEEDTKANQKLAIKEGKKNLPKLLKYMRESFEEDDEQNENVRKLQIKWSGNDEDDEDEYAEGGQAGKKGKLNATYIPKRNIKTLTTTYGNTIKGKDLLDGAYTTRKDIRQDPKMVRTMFEEEEFAEFNNGGQAKKRRRKANIQTGRTDRSVDKTRVAKPVGYRFTNSLASKLRKDEYAVPTEKQITKYIGKGIYKENRKNRSDKDRTIKL